MASRSSKLDKISEFIGFLARAGGWCSVPEVAEATKLSEDKVEGIIRVFVEAKFAEFDGQLRRVKLGPLLRDLYISFESDVNLE